MGRPQEEMEGRRKREVRIFIPLLSPSRAPPAGCAPQQKVTASVKVALSTQLLLCGGTAPSAWQASEVTALPAVTSPALHYPSGFPYTLLTPQQSLYLPFLKLPNLLCHLFPSGPDWLP